MKNAMICLLALCLFVTSAIAVAFLGSGLSPTAAAQGTSTWQPQILFSLPGTTCYQAPLDLFAVDATSIAMRFETGGTPTIVGDDPVDGRLLWMQARVDSSGNLVGGVPAHDFVLTGQVTVPGHGTFSGLLLTGEVTFFSSHDSGGPTDSYELRFSVTGGDIDFLFEGQEIVVSLVSEESTFEGDFTEDFCGEVKGTILGSPVTHLDRCGRHNQ
jgi:hypothetical protein